MAGHGRHGGLTPMVIDHMKRSGRPCTTLELAKAVGKTRQELNRTLYELQRQGIIKKIRDSPPLWQLVTITGGHSVSMSRRGGGGFRGGKGRGRGQSPTPPSVGYQFDGQASYYFPHVQRGQHGGQSMPGSEPRGGASFSGTY